MKISIDTKELNVTDCYAFQHPNGKRILRITLPQSEIEYVDLIGILDNISGTIILTKDNGDIHIFAGYKTTYELTNKIVNDVKVFYIEIYCTEEAERKAAEASAKAALLEEKLTTQAQTIAMQDVYIKELNKSLLEVQLATVDLYEKNLAFEAAASENETLDGENETDTTNEESEV